MKPKTKKGKKDAKRGKGKATNKRVENVVFDLSARNEFVTGFHKRKKELKKKKIEKSIEMFKEEKRKTLREKRAKLVEMKQVVEKIDGIAAAASANPLSTTSSNSKKYTTTVTVQEFDPDQEF